MKKNGFTLVELLAVIVVLAIISIITIPMIGNVIEESKKKALEQSINGLVESARYYSIDNDGTYEFLFDENKKGETINGDSLDYRGSIDAEGKLYLDNDGNISICVYNDKYYAYKNYNSGIVIGNRSEDNCDIGYDVISNKYIAFLESEGMSSNIYSKDEVNNLIDNLNSKVTANTNEITNIKSTIETLQNNLNDYALKSSLNETNTNLNNLSSIVGNHQSSISTLQTSINNINSNLTIRYNQLTDMLQVLDSNGLWHDWKSVGFNNLYIIQDGQFQKGFSAIGGGYAYNGYKNITTSVSEESNYVSIYNTCTYWDYSGSNINNLVDVTNYSKLHISYNLDFSGSDLYTSIGLSLDSTQGNQWQYLKSASLNKGNNDLELDISSITGKVYINFNFNNDHGSSSNKINLKIFNLWFE